MFRRQTSHPRPTGSHFALTPPRQRVCNTVRYFSHSVCWGRHWGFGKRRSKRCLLKTKAQLTALSFTSHSAPAPASTSSGQQGFFFFFKNVIVLSETHCLLQVSPYSAVPLCQLLLVTRVASMTQAEAWALWVTNEYGHEREMPVQRFEFAGPAKKPGEDFFVRSAGSGRVKFISRLRVFMFKSLRAYNHRT